MFRSLFDPNSAFSRGMERVWTLVVLNVLWVLCSLPVVTIGPSTAALYQVKKGEGMSSARTFSAPSASTAIEATTAESMPPERPIEAFA